MTPHGQTGHNTHSPRPRLTLPPSGSTQHGTVHMGQQKKPSMNILLVSCTQIQQGITAEAGQYTPTASGDWLAVTLPLEWRLHVTGTRQPVVHAAPQFGHTAPPPAFTEVFAMLHTGLANDSLPITSSPAACAAPDKLHPNGVLLCAYALDTRPATHTNMHLPTQRHAGMTGTHERMIHRHICTPAYCGLHANTTDTGTQHCNEHQTALLYSHALC